MTHHHGPKIVKTGDAPAAIGPYSQGVIAGNLLFISGQIPLDPVTGELVEGTIGEKADRIIRSIAAIAKAAGADLRRVVKTTIFLTDMADFAAVNDAYASHFGEILPARSTVQVAGLPKGVNIEMEAMVLLPE